MASHPANTRAWDFNGCRELASARRNSVLPFVNKSPCMERCTMRLYPVVSSRCTGRAVQQCRTVLACSPRAGERHPGMSWG